MNKRGILFKIITFSILCAWVFGFGHIIHMGNISNVHCGGVDNSHEICKRFINIQADYKLVIEKIVVNIVFILVSIFFIKLVLVKKIIQYVIQQYISPPLQELYSAGILNPKAP